MSTNSTTKIVSWAPNPDGRGTIDILWTCFATVFLCTWSAIHPDLPRLGEKEHRIFLRRIGYVLVGIMMPEWFAAAALSELSSAIWIKAQAPGWSLRQCFFMIQGGFVIESTSSHTERYRPNPEKLLSLFKSGTITWPEVSDDDISGRSRADWLVKGLAMIQMLYFVTSLITRWAQGLAVTTLELFTLGIVLCAIVTFVCWWSKPFDVQIPIVLFSDAIIPKKDRIDRIQFTSDENELAETWWTRAGGSVAGIAFGALHIAAWNFHFPSPTEQLLWRISSVSCTCLITCFVAYWYASDKFRSDGVFYFIFIPLYLLVRMYMFVEMFVSLRAVPESVYQTPQWSQYFPFLG